MKLNPAILKMAKAEANHHLKSDLSYTAELHRFLQGGIDAEQYLSSEFGFKKFLVDYGVTRTLKGGDEPKLQIIDIIRKFHFKKSHVNNIRSLSELIQQKGLSAHSGRGGPGLPQSFASKFLYVYRPDEIIPYDSYVLKSLQTWAGQSLKSLELYYEKANEFRLQYFHESSTEVRKLKKTSHEKIINLESIFVKDVDTMLSWKLTDKYLWCEENIRRTNL